MNAVRTAALALLFLLAPASRALALSPEEVRVIQEASVRYLASTPDNNFMVAPADVAARLRASKGDFVLVDLRTDKEFKAWHLPGSISVPYRDIADPTSLAKLPKDKDVILYCNSGQESAKVLSILRLLDYRAWSMKWGVMAWRTVPATAAALKAIAEGTTGTLPIAQ